MKKVIKIFTILLTVFSFLKTTNAAIKTSFAECFVGVNINYQNDINLTSIDGDDLLDSSAERTYFTLSYETLIDTNCDGNVADSEKKIENKILYCADGTKASPANDIKNGAYPKDKVPFKVCEVVEKNAKKISYVYENGYGSYNTNYESSKYLTGDYLKDYYITQSAIWYFTKPKEWMNNFEFSKGTYNKINNEISQKISKLILDAEAANAGASLKLETSSTKLTLTDDGQYYISSPIQLKGKYVNSQINITISGIAEAFATGSQNGTQGVNSFNNDSTIYIKIPVDKFIYDKEITINASATNSIDNSEVIQCGRGENSGYQPIIIHYPKNSTITDTLKLQNNTYTIQVSKQDITNTKEVKGATLTIKNSDGDIVSTWVSDNTPKSINLDPGVYTLEETIAPDGYIKSTSQIEFTVDNSGKVLVGGKEVSEIVITNNPILITISKRSIIGSDELKGAKLKITDKDGNIVKDISGNKLEWTSSDKSKTFQLKMGDYILSETIAPEGYELSETTIEFTINGEGKVLIDGKEVKDNLIIFENTPEPKQVPTGNTITYIAGALCLLSLVASIFIIMKRNKI